MARVDLGLVPDALTHASRRYDELSWALKVTKRPTRMTDNVKTFLMKEFEEGARTGNKADPVQVAREMKTPQK